MPVRVYSKDMTEKKKKSTKRELLIGSGLVLLFSSLILLALAGALISVGVVFLFALDRGDALAPLGPALLVYGVLLIIMVLAGYKFSARFAFLVKRGLGILRERRRLPDTSRLALREDEAPDIDMPGTHEQQVDQL